MIITKPSSYAPASNVDWSRRNFLIVEDFLSFRITLRKMLNSLNIHHIDEASDGEQAVRRMSGKKYDIVLCDYNLGSGKDGQQVLEEVKHLEYIDYSAIFVMVTAENTSEMIMGAIEYQPDDYLIKPFTKDILEKKLKDAVKKKELLKDAAHAIVKKDYEHVIAICNELMAGNPKNLTELLKLKGEALIKIGAYDEAASFYQEILSMGNLPWAMLGLGKVRFLTGQLEEAKDTFTNIINQNDKITAAYDWLARIHEKKGNLQEAQQTLQEAVRISPKVINRQKTLGSIAYKNKDIVTAEHSFKEAVRQGKNSIFKSPSVYTGLAKVYVDKGTPEESLKVLGDAGKEFANNAEATVQIAATESMAYKKMNRETDAKKAADKALQLSATLPNKLGTDIELDLAKALFMTGDSESGKAIVRRIVQSNHEDDELIENVQSIFKDLNIEDQGQKIISSALDEIVTLNNEGVRLVQQGDFDKAIEFFDQAVEQLPDNKIINANAAHALLLYVQKSGSDPSLLKKALKYINNVKNQDPSYKNLENLLSMYKELIREA
jgi:tetratricopeptide (TPR) repeat protein